MDRMVDLDQSLEQIRLRYDLPAIAGAAVTSQGCIRQAVLGERKYGSGISVTTADRFHLGSCGKAISATLIAMLVEQQYLDWQTTLAEIFAELGDRLHPSYRQVTVEQLLTHTAGFPANEVESLPFDQVFTLPGSPRQQRRIYVDTALTHPPATEVGTFAYSNMGYAVAGAMAEQVMDQAWEDLLIARLFQPVEMTTAGFGAMGTPGLIDQPWQHYGEGDDRQAINPGPFSDNPPAIAPAGTVHCSIQDWGKFVSLHLQGEQGTSTLLQPETLRKLHTPPAGGEYALGWGIADREWSKGVALWHTGSNTISYAVVWLAPKLDFAALVVTNQGLSEKTAIAANAAVGVLIHDFL